MFFGIRAALPESGNSTQFAQQHGIRFTTVDYQNARCTLGQWDVAGGTLALFPGSTVPSMRSIAAAKPRGGLGTNQLLPGRYP